MKNEKIDEKIQRIVDINEIKLSSQSPIIAAVEQCHFESANKLSTRDRWYQNYTVPGSYVTPHDFQAKPKYKVGSEVSSIEAVNDPKLNSDFRPRVFDNITKSWTLLDSGSCVSCTPKGPDDKIDPTFRLRAVNGQSIPTFGTQMVKVRIGRKQYEIEAIKTDIDQQILGWDLFRKYNLGFDWDCGELFITDKKAKIRSLLKFIKIDPQATKSVMAADLYEEPQFEHISPQDIYFNTECMKNLDESTSSEATLANQIDAMTIHPDQPSPIAENIPLGDIDPDSKAEYQVNLDALNLL